MSKGKIDFYDLVDLVEYYDYYRAKVNGISGYIYKADKISDEAKAKLESYSNVLLLKGNCEYAPEIKFNAVFVGDKAFK